MVLIRLFRIAEIENKIGGGLIEEVIQVAEGELRLVEELAKEKPYVDPHAYGNGRLLTGFIQMGRAGRKAAGRAMGIL